MPILLPILLNFQGSAHLFGVGSFSYLHALYIEYAEIEKTKKKQEEWLKKIVENYNKFKKAEILDYYRILSK